MAFQMTTWLVTRALVLSDVVERNWTVRDATRVSCIDIFEHISVLGSLPRCWLRAASRAVRFSLVSFGNGNPFYS